MKALQCELCGSNDILKTDGFFVCQHCGTKYSVEEARKMLIEGVVEIQGSVTIDNSAHMKNYLKIARNAKAKGDWIECEKYYDLVKQNDPENFEATFYSLYGRAKNTLLNNNIQQRKDVFSVLIKSVSLIINECDGLNIDDAKALVLSITSDICKMIEGDFAFEKWSNGFGEIFSTDVDITRKLFIQLGTAIEDSITRIIKKRDHAYLHQALIDLYNSYRNVEFIDVYEKETYSEKITAETDKREQILLSRNEAYWKEHQGKRNVLESERDQLISKIESLPKSAEMQLLETQISRLNEAKELTSFMFNYKKWNKLTLEILELNKEMDELKNTYDPVSFPLKERLAEINSELTKER